MVRPTQPNVVRPATHPQGAGVFYAQLLSNILPAKKERRGGAAVSANARSRVARWPRRGGRSRHHVDSDDFWHRPLTSMAGDAQSVTRIAGSLSLSQRAPSDEYLPVVTEFERRHPVWNSRTGLEPRGIIVNVSNRLGSGSRRPTGQLPQSTQRGLWRLFG